MRRLSAPILALVALLWGAAGLAAEPIDLGEAALYVRRGFDRSWVTDKLDILSGEWLPIARDGGRSYAVRDLDIPGLEKPERDWFRREPESFTYAYLFTGGRELINMTGLAVLLPRVGQGWSLYLNGELIRNEITMGPSGRLFPERTVRGYIVPLDKRRIAEGANILAIHVYGDPGDERTGIGSADPFLIDAYARLARVGGEYLDLLLIGIYAFFGLYHAALFLLRPSQRPYLAFAVGAILVSFYVFTRTGIAARIMLDTAILRVIDYVCLFLIMPVFVLFFETNLTRRRPWFGLVSIAIAAALAAGQAIFRAELMHNLWELVAAACLAWSLFGVFVPRLVMEARAAAPGARLRALLRSDASRLLPGLLVVIAAAGVDIVVVNRGGSMVFSKYAFLFLVLGASWVLADQFSRAHAGLSELSASLERKVEERQAELAAARERQARLAGELERSNRELAVAAEADARDLLVAERLQSGLFPAEPPRAAGWELAQAFRSASGVSGDFFDYYLEGEELRGIVVGDVSGHGVGSGLVSVLARSVFERRFREARGKPLAAFMAGLQEELSGELGGVDEYLTALVLRFDGGRVEYLNAAHPDLLVRRAGAAKVVALAPKGGEGGFRGPPLGPAGFEDHKWTALRFALGPGDFLLAYTDCLVEARGRSGEAYGHERLAARLASAEGLSARRLMAELIADFDAFTAGSPPTDDLTVILARRV